MTIPEPSFEIVIPVFTGGVLFEKGARVLPEQLGAFWPDAVALGAVRPVRPEVEIVASVVSKKETSK